MAQVNTGSEFLEYLLTPEEDRIGRALQNPLHVMMRLQNKKMEIFQQITSLDFTPEKQEQSMRDHVYLRGKYDTLTEILNDFTNAVSELQTIAAQQQQQSTSLFPNP